MIPKSHHDQAITTACKMIENFQYYDLSSFLMGLFSSLFSLGFLVHDIL
jgi:hypothetical protein